MIELLLLGIGFLVAFIGTMSGGGAGLITLLVLLSLGMPLNNAIATNRVGDLGFFFPALRNLIKAKQIKWKALPPIVFINLLGATVGTFLVAWLDESGLRKLVIAILILLLVSSVLRKEYALKERPARWYWPFVYFATSMSSGALGAGTGILSTMSLMYFRGFNALQSMAHSFFANLFGWSLSITILLFTDLINYRYAIILFVGNTIGAHFGSKIAIKKGNGFVRYMIMILALCVVLQLVFIS